MTHRIFKYPLKQGAHTLTTIDLTVGSFPVHVGVQDGEPILWASVCQNYDKPLRFQFECIPTGGTWSDTEAVLFKTVQMPSGLVWHYAYTILP